MQIITNQKENESSNLSSPTGGQGAALISDEVKEIISYRPHWMIRRGNMLFFLVLLSLLALTWFMEYPDIVNATSRLVALNAPKLITAKQEGKLNKLFVKDQEQVYKGQHLGYIESTADYEQVRKLHGWMQETIKATEENNYSFLNSNPLPSFTNLGELQSSYQNFQNQFIQTKQILSHGYFQKKQAALQKDLKYLAALKNATYQQQELLEQDQRLQNTEYSAYETLAKDKVIAPLELNQYKSKLIAKEQSLKLLNTQLTNNDIASHNKTKEILDLQKSVMDQKQNFNSALLDLKASVEKWIQQYVLVASEDGKLLFNSSLQENELLANGQGLFFIQPQETRYYAELMAGQKGLGKVKEGQKVMLKAESFPSEEYGFITGKVESISNMPNRRDSFLIKVSLPEGLKTNYQKEIFFRNHLSAHAEIITDERKLFDRLWGQLKQVWERN